MSFLWVNLLWILFIIPAAVLVYILLQRRKRKAALRFANLAMVKAAMGSKAGLRRHIPAILFLISLSVMLFAVSRPAAVVTLPSTRGTVILAMDISGSMRATDVEPTRLAAAKAAALQFIDQHPINVKIGVVAFAGTSNNVQVPTSNREEVAMAIDRLRNQRGTAVGSGIFNSLVAIFDDLEFDLMPSDGPMGAPLGQRNSIEQNTPDPVPPGTYSSAVIVLLTDGRTTAGPDPIRAARQAADLGVRVFTVGLGTNQGSIVGFGGRSMRVTLDEETLRTIAETTDGKYFQAGSESDLKEVYNALSTQFVMETEKTELTALFTAIAAVFAIAAGLLSVLWFGRIV